MVQILTAAKEHPYAAAVILLFTHFIVSFLRKGYEVRRKFRGLVRSIASSRDSWTPLLTFDSLVLHTIGFGATYLFFFSC